MRKITDFVIDKRYYILFIFIVLTILCGFLSTKVKVNHDMAKYLPNTSMTHQGIDIMNEEFSETKTSSLNLMIENLTNTEKEEALTYLTNLSGISKVDYDNTSSYNKDIYTLYVISVDEDSTSDLAKEVYDNITNHFADYKFYTSGDISQTNSEVLPFYIIALAVFLAFIILIIMCNSYLEPILFLAVIFMAIILNDGTNIIFDNVSFITKAISAILQLALSMDYSIMLINRYNQEKETEKDKIKAMKKALSHAFLSISSSSFTTIAGLLALVFMSFTIGKDLGFVLAKGVLFSLICIFFVLPTLILLFDKLITKTQKKSPNIKLKFLATYSYKIRYFSIFLFLGVLITSYILKGNLGYDYTNAKDDKITNVFTENNQIALIYNNKNEYKIGNYLSDLENNPQITKVLGYQNTINQKIKADMLNSKLEDLGTDITVDEYLINIIYYDYYNKENKDKMSFEKLIDFVENDVYNNDNFADKIDEQTKNDINRLKNFTSLELMNELKNPQQIANILDINEEDIKDLFILYLANQENLNLSIPDFLTFAKEIAKNPEYNIDLDKINKITKFTKPDLIKNKTDYNSIAQLFNIDKELVKKLYLYNINNSNLTLKLNLNTFANFVLNDVISNKEYAKLFTNDLKEQLKQLSVFSDQNLINQKMNSSSLAQTFNIEEENILPILLLKYLNTTDNTTYQIADFLKYSLEIKKNTNYLDNYDLSELEKLQNLKQVANTKMNYEKLSNLFSKNIVDIVYQNQKKETLMTPLEFVKIVLKNEKLLDKKTLQTFKTIQNVMESNKQYQAQEMANVLGISKDLVIPLYNLINYQTKNTSKWVSTPYEFVKLILNNKDKVKESISTKTFTNLHNLLTIMDNSQKQYNYQEIAKFLKIDENTTKSIYSLNLIDDKKYYLNPLDFVNLILNNQNDKQLSNIDKNIINELNTLKQVMQNILANNKLNYESMSNLFTLDNESTKLLYGLYNFNHSKTKLSLQEFISFLLNDVVNNPKYNFTNDKTTKLKTLNGIMKSVINNVEYTSDEMIGILSTLADDISKNTLDTIYVYYGSKNKYQKDWTMTIEEFINYLNDDILNDERFNDFITEENKTQIKDAKNDIQDAKKMLLGQNYSRIILNTSLEREGKNTFTFVKNIYDTLGKDMDDFYLVGDSPMAYDMSTTFDKELNNITIITMIVIFIVVALTFKSFIIPTILVLIIQCAVYLIMGILSFSGENVYFIAILIVQSILMGATIDYAILYTSYYLEHRKTMNIKNAIINSYEKSLHTILTSASILIIVTLIVGHFASDIASKICLTISRGTICSTILILLLLPSVLCACDKIIVKK